MPRGKNITTSTITAPKNSVWICGKWLHSVSLIAVRISAPTSGPATVPTPPKIAMTIGKTLSSSRERGRRIDEAVGSGEDRAGGRGHRAADRPGDTLKRVGVDAERRAAASSFSRIATKA